MLTSQFFCLSLISTAMNKAPRLYNLSTLSLKCSGVGGGEKKRKKKRLHVTAQVELGRDSSVSFDFSV